MVDQVNVYTNLPLPGTIMQLLESRLPSSLPLLRRLQSGLKQEDDSKYYRIVLIAGKTSKVADHPKIHQYNRNRDDTDPHLESLDIPLTIAFVEFGARPDTQLWIYSTFEDVPDDEVQGQVDLYRFQMRNMVGELKQLRQEYPGESAFGQSVLLGSAHSPRVMGLLQGYKRYKPENVGTYDKWLFRVEDLPEQTELPAGLVWDNASEDDCQVAISHATVPLPL